MRAKRLVLKTASGLEVRLRDVEEVGFMGRKVVALNHLAWMEAWWFNGVAYGQLRIVDVGTVPLGPIWPGGLKLMERLAHNPKLNVG